MGRTQAHERRHDVASAGVLHALRHPLRLGGLLHDLQLVPEPLHGGASDVDRTLQRVLGASPEVPGHGGQEPLAGYPRVVAHVHQQEPAGPEGYLHIAPVEAGLAEQGRLLVAEGGGDGDLRADDVGVRDAEDMARRARLREHPARDAQDVQEVVVPAQVGYVEHHCTGGVGIVCGVHPPSGEVPYDPGLHSPEEDAAVLGALPGPGDVLQHPPQLGPGEVGVYLQPGLRQDGLPQSAVPQLLAERVGPAVLPHDGVAHRDPRPGVPHHGGLPLIGDAHGNTLVGIDPGLGQAVCDGLPAQPPDLRRVVLHHAGPRIDLPQVPLGHRQDLAAVPEQHAAHAGGPGIHR